MVNSASQVPVPEGEGVRQAMVSQVALCKSSAINVKMEAVLGEGSMLPPEAGGLQGGDTWAAATAPAPGLASPPVGFLGDYQVGNAG